MDEKSEKSAIFEDRGVHSVNYLQMKWYLGLIFIGGMICMAGCGKNKCHTCPPTNQGSKPANKKGIY
jgi:hypothetical protein